MSLISITPPKKDLGGFEVRRALPNIKKRAISYFVFLDHMGPAELAADRGMNVRPHPHIALATVTYLFDGKIVHRDSLGSDQVITAGDVNWMTAGRGIVHSERSPKEPLKMHGLQIWVALPKEREDIDPSFHHHPKSSLPEFRKDDAELKLILGEFLDKRSPVKLESEIFYLDSKLKSGKKLNLDFKKDHEAGLYTVAGEISVRDVEADEEESFSAQTLIVLKQNRKYEITALKDSHFVFFGGEAMPEPRFIWWNFVSSSQDKIEKAKHAWKNQQMGQVPGETEFIPLPED